jgi:histidinol phosphatase-like enzyme
MIGDKESDIAAAKAANVEGLIYDGGNLREFLARHLKKISAHQT